MYDSSNNYCYLSLTKFRAYLSVEKSREEPGHYIYPYLSSGSVMVNSATYLLVMRRITVLLEGHSADLVSLTLYGRG
jgi:hypothetical protein